MKAAGHTLVCVALIAILLLGPFVSADATPLVDGTPQQITVNPGAYSSTFSYTLIDTLASMYVTLDSTDPSAVSGLYMCPSQPCTQQTSGAVSISPRTTKVFKLNNLGTYYFAGFSEKPVTFTLTVMSAIKVSRGTTFKPSSSSFSNTGYRYFMFFICDENDDVAIEWTPSSNKVYVSTETPRPNEETCAGNFCKSFTGGSFIFKQSEFPGFVHPGWVYVAISYTQSQGPTIDMSIKADDTALELVNLEEFKSASLNLYEECTRSFSFVIGDMNSDIMFYTWMDVDDHLLQPMPVMWLSEKHPVETTTNHRSSTGYLLFPKDDFVNHDIQNNKLYLRIDNSVHLAYPWYGETHDVNIIVVGTQRAPGVEPYRDTGFELLPHLDHPLWYGVPFGMNREIYPTYSQAPTTRSPSYSVGFRTPAWNDDKVSACPWSISVSHKKTNPQKGDADVYTVVQSWSGAMGTYVTIDPSDSSDPILDYTEDSAYFFGLQPNIIDDDWSVCDRTYLSMVATPIYELSNTEEVMHFNPRYTSDGSGITPLIIKVPVDVSKSDQAMLVSVNAIDGKASFQLVGSSINAIPVPYLDCEAGYAARDCEVITGGTVKAPVHEFDDGQYFYVGVWFATAGQIEVTYTLGTDFEFSQSNTYAMAPVASGAEIILESKMFAVEHLYTNMLFAARSIDKRENVDICMNDDPTVPAPDGCQGLSEKDQYMKIVGASSGNFRGILERNMESNYRDADVQARVVPSKSSPATSSTTIGFMFAGYDVLKSTNDGTWSAQYTFTDATRAYYAKFTTSAYLASEIGFNIEGHGSFTIIACPGFVPFSMFDTDGCRTTSINSDTQKWGYIQITEADTGDWFVGIFPETIDLGTTINLMYQEATVISVRRTAKATVMPGQPWYGYIPVDPIDQENAFISIQVSTPTGSGKVYFSNKIFHPQTGYADGEFVFPGSKEVNVPVSEVGSHISIGVFVDGSGPAVQLSIKPVQGVRSGHGVVPVILTHDLLVYETMVIEYDVTNLMTTSVPEAFSVIVAPYAYDPNVPIDELPPNFNYVWTIYGGDNINEVSTSKSNYHWSSVRSGVHELWIEKSRVEPVAENDYRIYVSVTSPAQPGVEKYPVSIWLEDYNPIYPLQLETPVKRQLQQSSLSTATNGYLPPHFVIEYDDPTQVIVVPCRGDFSIYGSFVEPYPSPKGNSFSGSYHDANPFTGEISFLVDAAAEGVIGGDVDRKAYLSVYGKVGDYFQILTYASGQLDPRPTSPSYDLSITDWQSGSSFVLHWKPASLQATGGIRSPRYLVYAIPSDTKSNVASACAYDTDENAILLISVSDFEYDMETGMLYSTIPLNDLGNSKEYYINLIAYVGQLQRAYTPVLVDADKGPYVEKESLWWISLIVIGIVLIGVGVFLWYWFKIRPKKGEVTGYETLGEGEERVPEAIEDDEQIIE